MVEQYLNRADAPFESSFWELLDTTVRSVASGQLGARKLLHTEGPYGLGSASVPATEERIASESDAMTEVSITRPLPLTLISGTFVLSARSIAASRQTGMALDLRTLVQSVLSCTAKEDSLLFYGSEAIGVGGLTNTRGIHNVPLKPWNEPGQAVDSVLEAIRKLDGAGFGGPYTIALTPALYDLLFRRYPQSDILELDHMKTLATDGVVKALNLRSGAVVVASGRQFASIVLGQDLSAGFEGPAGRDFVFTLSESVALRLAVPQAACFMQPQ